MNGKVRQLAELMRAAPPAVLEKMADAVNGGAEGFDLGRVDARDMGVAMGALADVMLQGEFLEERPDDLASRLRALSDQVGQHPLAPIDHLLDTVQAALDEAASALTKRPAPPDPNPSADADTAHPF